VAPEAAAPESAAVEDPRSDDEVLAELGLPDPEGLKPGDDFSAFMARTVPARLRNRALRRLWVANPLLSAVDEMVEYGEDYTDAATVIENLQTAFQVGRGFVDKAREAAGAGPSAADGREAPPEADAAVIEGEGGPVADAAGIGAEADSWLDHAAAVAADDAGAGELVADRASARPEPAPVPRRRMRFRLAEE